MVENVGKPRMNTLLDAAFSIFPDILSSHVKLDLDRLFKSLSTLLA